MGVVNITAVTEALGKSGVDVGDTSNIYNDNGTLYAGNANILQDFVVQAKRIINPGAVKPADKGKSNAKGWMLIAAVAVLVAGAAYLLFKNASSPMFNVVAAQKKAAIAGLNDYSFFDENGVWKSEYSNDAATSPNGSNQKKQQKSSIMDEDKGSFWDSLFDNGGGILTGVANIVGAAKGSNANYNVPGGDLDDYLGGGATPQSGMNTGKLLLIGGGLLVVVLLFVFMNKKS